MFIPLIIKNYEFPQTLSGLITNGQANPVIFTGLHGKGLFSSNNLTGLHVFFVGGTGILPILDLIHLVFVKSFYEFFK